MVVDIVTAPLAVPPMTVRVSVAWTVWPVFVDICHWMATVDAPGAAWTIEVI